MQFKTIDFSKYSSFKIGGIVDVALLQNNFENINDYYLIGSCNNTLIGPNPPKLMMLDKQYDYIKIENDLLKIGGATPSGKIASFCKKHNITNFEFVSHLPGKLGGLVYMNAGLKEFEIFNHLEYITTPNGLKRKKEINFGYRFTNIHEPILEAAFELEYGFSREKVAMFKTMRVNQPSTPSAGSCFKNPEGDYAGRLIEAVGLKGKKVGNMEFSTEHANFLVNHGGGTFEDAVYLINEAQKRVFEEFGIKLELEIIILDTQTKTLF
ncbi:UDP-N-acetylmuramate dehydrogenase [Sulfurimonas autotrophica]|uniref:UDP-N-acetylenolpyruvoylglucosamine reductase n=1 Tax=Sulfurimonas autotrophica (strain ATCC BAA-671 / DSM 16294 / JCM 11897 / OK10) TaxID=563040 RepID=E0USX5_SULAO|nr:UDP-N-acetylmuramate dehydrogenase [Sulfurimonas autotrophica]ADN08152.1 UDP-N-acetylenolpyruvoylglucosamine reductase [Sulfurimonas autotrophica DSM 16294]